MAAGAFAETAEQLTGDLDGGGLAYLRLAVRGDDEQAVGRAFSGAVVETSLSSYPGTFFTSAPSGAQGVARYWPTTVTASAVTPRSECEGIEVPIRRRRAADAVRRVRRARAGESGAELRRRRRRRRPDAGRADTGPAPRPGRGPLGRQGGDANVGLWADAEDVAKWLQSDFTTEAFRTVLPEVAAFEIDRYPLPNLRAVNFVVHGFLGWGVASNLLLDTQAKGLGELLRSRAVEVPVALVASAAGAAPAARRAAVRSERNRGPAAAHLAG